MGSTGSTARNRFDVSIFPILISNFSSDGGEGLKIDSGLSFPTSTLGLGSGFSNKLDS